MRYNDSYYVVKLTLRWLKKTSISYIIYVTPFCYHWLNSPISTLPPETVDLAWFLLFDCNSCRANFTKPRDFVASDFSSAHVCILMHILGIFSLWCRYYFCLFNANRIMADSTGSRGSFSVAGCDSGCTSCCCWTLCPTCRTGNWVSA